MTYVRAQGGVDPEQVVSQMARTAGVKKTSEYLTGARALLEFMYVAGLVAPDGDTVRMPAAGRPPTTEAASPEKGAAPRPPGARAYGGGLAYDLEPVGPGTPGVMLHLNLSPSDLKTDAAADELAARIKRLLDALRSG